MNRTTKIIVPDFLDLVRSKSCLISHVHVGATECHHLIARGWRESKRNDLTAINLCRAAHSELEQIGVEKFQEKYKINLWKEAAWLLMEFFLDKSQADFVPVITIGKVR